MDAGRVAKSAALTKVRELIKEYRRLRDDGDRPIDPTTNTHYMLEHLKRISGTRRWRR